MKTMTPIPQRLELIRACRASGLTVAEWCRRNGLNDNTYHNWVTRLRKKGFLETPATIPESIPHGPIQQEIVKVEIASEPAPILRQEPPKADNVPKKTEGAVMEVAFGQIRIKVTNQVNPQLLAQALHLLGGGLEC